MRFNKKYDIVGLGGCGIDLRAQVPKLPSPNHKVIATQLEISEGGVTSNNLVQVAKLGLRTAWVGVLGNDSWAKHLTDKFKKTKVHFFPLYISKTPAQQFWIATDPKGEWNMVGIPGATRKLTSGHVRNKFSKIISLARHFHTEVAVIPLSTALEGAKIAKKNGTKILVDVDDDPWYLIEKEKIGTEKEFLRLLKLADVVKLSKTGALGLTKKKNISQKVIEKILKMGPKIVVVTMAEKGCVIVTSDKILHIPEFEIRPFDTVGAGDAFMGGFSYGLLKGWNLEKVGQFANACGAFKCTQFGTRSSGNFKEIDHFIKSHA